MAALKPSTLKPGTNVILLRTTRDLMESGIPLRRVKRVLGSLLEQLPEDQPLGALHITSDGDSVVVKEKKTV